MKFHFSNRRNVIFSEEVHGINIGDAPSATFVCQMWIVPWVSLTPRQCRDTLQCSRVLLFRPRTRFQCKKHIGIMQALYDPTSRQPTSQFPWKRTVEHRALLSITYRCVGHHNNAGWVYLQIIRSMSLY